MPSEGIRTKGTGPWHFCARCDRKTKIRQELRWQRSLLLCRDCFDTRVLGTYDADVSRVMSTLVENPDLQPDPKLLNPEIENSFDDILM